MRRTIYLYLLCLLLTMTACTDRKESGAAKVRAPQPKDTLYTQQRALAIYAYQPVRALAIIDSALIVGNIHEMQADLNRATVYSHTQMAEQLDSLMGWTGGERLDTARLIGERLLQHDSVAASPALRQDVLELLVYTARLQQDTARWLQRARQLVEVCHQQGAETEALRSEAEVGAALCDMGQTERGMAMLDSVTAILNEQRTFNALDAYIIAVKRKINVYISQGQYMKTIPLARSIIERLNGYEHHPDAYHDGSYREPANDTERTNYVRFYRNQAQNFIITAYTAIGESANKREVFEQLEHIVRDATAREHRIRYQALQHQMRCQEAEARARHSQHLNIVIVIALIAALSVLVWYWYQKRVITRKNHYLAEQIAEAMKYKEMYQHEHSHHEQPASTPVDLNTLSAEQLFRHISEVVVREQLFLDSNFNRQTLINRFQLSKDRIGAAFSQGSEHKHLSDYVQELRLNYAAQLLASHPDVSIVQVAAQSGFSSAQYFSTCFRQHYGMRPSDFRNARQHTKTINISHE